MEAAIKQALVEPGGLFDHPRIANWPGEPNLPHGCQLFFLRLWKLAGFARRSALQYRKIDLAQMMGCDAVTIKRWLATLHEAGLVDFRDGRGRQKSVLFDVHDPEDVARQRGFRAIVEDRQRLLNEEWHAPEPEPPPNLLRFVEAEGERHSVDKMSEAAEGAPEAEGPATPNDNLSTKCRTEHDDPRVVAFLERLRAELTEDQFNFWVAPLSLRMQDDAVVIGCTSDFEGQWLNGRALGPVLRKAARETPGVARVEMAVDPSLSSKVATREQGDQPPTLASPAQPDQDGRQSDRQNVGRDPPKRHFVDKMSEARATHSHTVVGGTFQGFPPTTEPLSTSHQHFVGDPSGGDRTAGGGGRAAADRHAPTAQAPGQRAPSPNADVPAGRKVLGLAGEIYERLDDSSLFFWVAIDLALHCRDGRHDAVRALVAAVRDAGVATGIKKLFAAHQLPFRGKAWIKQTLRRQDVTWNARWDLNRDELAAGKRPPPRKPARRKPKPK